MNIRAQTVKVRQLFYNGSDAEKQNYFHDPTEMK
jgi:hypothetical protein